MTNHGGGHGGSMTAAVFGIIKAMVGPAILYLPRGFADSGYAVALPVLAAATLMYVYSSSCLLQCWKIESEKRSLYDILAVQDDDDLWSPHDAEVAHEEEEYESGQEEDDEEDELKDDFFVKVQDRDDTFTSLLSNNEQGSIKRTGSNRTNKIVESAPMPKHISYTDLALLSLGEYGEAAVMIGITLMQLGVCLTYFIFVPQNLHHSMRVLYNVDIPLWGCLLLMELAVMPLSWIRDIRKLMYTNIAADLLILFGLISCLWFAVKSPNEESDNGVIQRMSELKPLNDKWFLFIGTSVLLFEGSITLCIPLQEAINGTESRQKFPSVYKFTIISIILFYGFFGLVCWSSFGDTVHTVLTTSLPDGVLSTSVQLAYSIAVIFTFPLQIYPAMEIICKSYGSLVGYPESKIPTCERSLIISLVIILLSIVAVYEMDRLEHVVSLMGALLGCPIAFVYPPIIHNHLVRTASLRTKRLNSFVACMGIIAMVGATTATLATWKN